MMRGEDLAVVSGFFVREIGGEHSVGAGFAGGAREFLKTHLQDGIVVAEEDQRNLRCLADVADEIDDAGERGAGLEGALRRALDGGPIGERTSEGEAKLDNVGTGLARGERKFERRL